MRICFMGASEFGFRCLNTVMNIPEIEVVGVLTAKKQFKISYSPNKPVTNVLHFDFSKLAENKKTFPIYTVEKGMNNPEVVKFVKDCAPDFILVVGWYHMVPAIIRKIPPKGTAGIHASLLPRYSGGAPLVWAIINGERETGLSFFYFDEGVDTGDIIGIRRIPIRLNDSISTVYNRVEEEGISLLKEMLPRIAAGTAPRIPQEKTDRNVWPQRGPDDGKINWRSSSLEIYNFIRAQTKPYPGAFSFIRGEKIIIWDATFYNFTTLEGAPGQVLEIINNEFAKGFLVSTKDNDLPLLITKVGTEKNPMMNAYDYAQRENLKVGQTVGQIKEGRR